ncbi:MAG TPA: arylamine N-acetyltransferase [Chryseolinea sp.]|nr:arylamine N-acetyltransferase [Chryseolinea sp.]
MSQPSIDSALDSQTVNKTKFNLDGYFKRIGYVGSTDPTLETLRSIHLRHAQSIPFENLNPFLRIPVVLDIDSLYQKLVLDGRGGYCFEHNLLLTEVLKSMRYSVKGLGARVLWNIPEGIVTARGHMLLLVEIDHDYFIADVGFGGLTLTAPLALIPNLEQDTPHEKFKLIQIANDYVLQAKVQGAWKRIYSFGLQENFLIDYEVTSWYLSNHPTSHFVTGLIAALPFENGRHTLRNNDFATHYLDGSHERKRFDNVADLQFTLETTFGIRLPQIPSIDSSLERIIQVPIRT